MVNQDAVTALNPGLTVGYQIAEMFRIHRPGTSREEARRRARGADGPGPDPVRRPAGTELSPRVLGGHEPAGHDRDGDRARARHPHRGRADDGARRHRAGADHAAPRRAPRADRHGPHPHHPRPRRRRGERRERPRHVRRAHRRAWSDRGGHRAPGPSLHRGAHELGAPGPSTRTASSRPSRGLRRCSPRSRRAAPSIRAASGARRSVPPSRRCRGRSWPAERAPAISRRRSTVAETAGEARAGGSKASDRGRGAAFSGSRIWSSTTRSVRAPSSGAAAGSSGPSTG